MPRLFLALEIPDDVRAEIAEAQIALKGSFRHSKIRWVPPENLHVTLHFLGDVPDDRVAPLVDDFRSIKTPEPFPLTLDHLGAFPNLKKPRIIMAETTVHPFLFLLRRRLADVIVSHGININGKQFRPHITLGRVTTQSETFPEKVIALKPLRWMVDGYTLMQSTLTEDGSVYEPVRHFSLKP